MKKKKKPLCSKKGWPNNRQAEQALQTIKSGSKRGIKPIRTYHCPICDFWHLTSQSKCEF